MPTSEDNQLDGYPIFACVRVGSKYGPEYVERLHAGVRRWYPHPHSFMCLEDAGGYYGRGVWTLSVRGHGLAGYWAKMCLFQPEWRAGQRVIYLDLDSVIVGDLTPLVSLDMNFGVCASFTRAAGHSAWPCRYGSCCMVLGPEMNGHVWHAFQADRDGLMARAGKFGDQAAIEELVPDADLLQEHLPPGFFLGYRDLPKYPNGPPSGAAICVFAGSHKPDNCDIPWVREAWEH